MIVEARASERTLPDILPGASFTFTQNGVRRTGTVVKYVTTVAKTELCPACAFIVNPKTHDKVECDVLRRAADDMERADETLADMEANGAR